MPVTDAGPATRALRLRRGVPVLDRGPDRLQLGSDTRWSLVVCGLSDGERAWLREAATSRHDDLEHGAARHRVAPERRAQIVAALTAGGFLVPTAAPPGTVLATAGGAADAPTLAALRPDGDGLRTLTKRARRQVAVLGLGRLGALTAAHLASAGLGAVMLDDDRPVQLTDLGLGLYREADVGHRRAARLQSVLAARHPRTRFGSTWRDEAPPDVVVVCGGTDPPEAFARLMSHGLAHLPLVAGEAGIEVGPFVRPGTTACTACRYHHEVDADPDWPRLVAQLAARPGDAGQETVLATTGAAVAAGQVLAHLDGARPAAADAVLEISLPDPLPRVRAMPPHPACGCTGTAPPPAADRSG
ncbi:ThiF family adenylyltransferase [Isoptericola sp. 178]|uniref:ThiF family adenylyltransferase n=1 Tax=Isoptericola sp. 178 TaxID=3064651 RepID=UPI0027141857|nr:ThiF family adenylyltransferase [Isoptericola sp. 178]MDO8144222.1 ThiF family adenylyltransferase [Isoptericola sp. 178]